MNDILNHLDLHLVSLRFEKALPTYNEHAVVQRQMAEKLVSAMRNCFNGDVESLFEIGCGTGILTCQILQQFSVKKYTANDIVGKVEPIVREIMNGDCSNFVFLEGDGNEIDYPDNSRMICSGATVQWFSDLDLFFGKSSKALFHEGILAFSTFGLQHFNEIRQLTGEGLDYFTKNEMITKGSKYFRLLHSEEWIQIMEFDHPVDVLHHIKSTGVGGVGAHHWNKNTLNQFIGDYEQFRTDEGKYTLTYQPQIFVFKKN